MEVCVVTDEVRDPSAHATGAADWSPFSDETIKVRRFFQIEVNVILIDEHLQMLMILFDAECVPSGLWDGDELASLTRSSS